MGICVGIIGAGAFAQEFIPLFKAHPLVDHVVLCDQNAEKLAAVSQQFDIAETLPSLDDACDSNLDAVAIFTQNWLHGPQSVQALHAGKHVYSAVPSAITLDEMTALVDAVTQTGNIYMLGETSYYYPEAIYCRQKHADHAFGKIVYAEAEYLHDWDHGLYDVMKWRGGDHWLRTAGHPPMFYPTHSIGMVLSVTGAHFTHVSCQGFEDHHDDGIYQPNINEWDNRFSNQTALFKVSDGSSCRINEFRRVGHPGCERMSIWGTDAGFEHNWAGHMWVTKDRERCERLDDLLTCRDAVKQTSGGMEKIGAEAHKDVSAVHPIDRLPSTFRGLTNGHAGSHQFLVDDFVKAVNTSKQPPVDVWKAARYLIPGLIAHESSVRQGELLAIPDLGDGPNAHPHDQPRVDMHTTCTNKA